MATITSGNVLLDSLTDDTRLALNAREETHDIGVVLIRPEETPEFVFFPHPGAVVSIVRSTENGTTVEAGVVGSEGLFHLQTAITTAAPTASQALVQIEGRFSRVAVGVLRDCFADDRQFRDAILAFTNLFLAQVTQNLVCNRLHAIEQRLTKWLLVTRDRIATDELHLTHDFLSHMLGIHRPGVSIAVSALEMDGLILHGRNRITIRDDEGLRSRSCECYPLIHKALLDFRSTFEA